jgi:hypothetical protein
MAGQANAEHFVDIYLHEYYDNQNDQLFPVLLIRKEFIQIRRDPARWPW